MMATSNNTIRYGSSDDSNNYNYNNNNDNNNNDNNENNNNDEMKMIMEGEHEQTTTDDDDDEDDILFRGVYYQQDDDDDETKEEGADIFNYNSKNNNDQQTTMTSNTNTTTTTSNTASTSTTAASSTTKQQQQQQQQEQQRGGTYSTVGVGSTTSPPPPGNSPTSTSNRSKKNMISFVDYIPPPKQHVPPPAKYKLWIILMILVYSAEWFSSEANFRPFLEDTFLLSPNASRFILLGTIVFTLSYGGSDVFKTLLSFKKVVKSKTNQSDGTNNSNNNNDDKVKWYGINAWLKQPRIATSIRKYNSTKHYFILELIELIVSIFEDGFSMFDSPKGKKEKQQQQQQEKTSSQTQAQRQTQAQPQTPAEDGGGSGSGGGGGPLSLHRTMSIPRVDSSTGRAVFDYSGADQHRQDEEDHDVVLKVMTRVNPTRRNEFQIWKQRFIKSGVRSRPGLRATYTECISNDNPDVGDLYTSYLTFKNIDYLNMYMISPVRTRLVQNLQPLLVCPNSMQLQQQRILPDEFTDLSNPQGQSVPKRLPRKWKVWWINTLGLFCVTTITSTTFEFYFPVWGLGPTAHPRLKAFVRVIINSFLSSYIAIPLLTMFFGDWLIRRDDDDDDNDSSNKDDWMMQNIHPANQNDNNNNNKSHPYNDRNRYTSSSNKQQQQQQQQQRASNSNSNYNSNHHEPWRTFNDGFTSIYGKVMITLLFYGGCAIVWIIRKKRICCD